MYIEIRVDGEVYISAAEEGVSAEEIRDKTHEVCQATGTGPMAVNLFDGGFMFMPTEKVQRAVLIFRDGEPDEHEGV